MDTRRVDPHADVPDPILVTGFPRSGTSLVAGMLWQCGAWADTAGRKPDEHNPRGYFESPAMNGAQAGLSLRAVEGGEALGRAWGPATFRDRVVRALRVRGWLSGPWLFKATAICTSLDCWRAAFPGARYVVVRRAQDECVASAMRVPMCRAYGDEAFWRRAWEAYRPHLDRVAAEKAATTVWPGELLSAQVATGEVPEVWEQLAGCCGLEWGPAAARFVEPGLWGRSAEAAR